jgi:hypothetical protein
VLRSIGTAFADLGAEPTKTGMHLAVEFALQGWADGQHMRLFAGYHGESLPASSGNRGAVVSSGGLLVWRAYLQRLARQLTELLSQNRQRNPLRTELSETQVARLLGLEQPGLAGAALDELAQMYNLRPAWQTYPRSFTLVGVLAPPAPKPEEKAVADTIHKELAADPGLSRRDLAALHPSSLNVIAWLYDAELLVELPGWLSIPRAELRRYLRTIPAGPGKTPPAVRDLKDRLGIGRRLAEGLRAWYVAQAEGAPSPAPRVQRRTK